MLASRGYNIDSLAVARRGSAPLANTFVVVGDDRVLEQVRRQLRKIVTSCTSTMSARKTTSERDLMLIKLQAPAAATSELRELAEIFRGADRRCGARGGLIVEISGQERKLERSSI